MADPNVNTNPNLKSLPGEAGNFFAGVNSRIRNAEKKARNEAEGQLLPSDIKMQIDELRQKIANNVNIVKDKKDTLRATALNGLIASTNLYKKQKDDLLTNNKFEEKYANLQNEKRIARKRQREPSSVQVPPETVMNEVITPSSAQVPSAEDMVKASEEADAALAAADEVLTEPDDELPLPPREPDSANANKLAKVIADSLTTAAQPSLTMPPAPPIAEDVEADMPAPFNVTEKPQPVPVQEPTITPGALANVIINALKLASAAPVPVPVPAPEPVPVPVPAPEPAQVTQEPTILPGALANVIVNALKLASTVPAPVPAPVPITAPVPVPITAPITAPVPMPVPAPITQAQEPTILPGELANVIVNALKLATTQAIATPETVQPTTTPVTELPNSSEPAITTVAADKCSESPGFISLIQKYLEPIIGQFSPPENKPQKVFDIEKLPENMRRILDDTNIRYIGRYRTGSNPGKNDSSKGEQTQTTYLFWNTSTHDYTSQTVNEVLAEKETATKTQAPGTQLQLPAEAQSPSIAAVQEQPRQKPITLSQVPKLKQPALTTDELADKLPPPPTTDPRVAKKRRIADRASPRSVIPLGAMI